MKHVFYYLFKFSLLFTGLLFAAQSAGMKKLLDEILEEENNDTKSV